MLVFKIHRYTTPHGRWNWSWFSVSLLVTGTTSKDYDYQGIVGILLIIQLQRGLLVMDWLPVFHPWLPCLVEAIPQKRGVHTFFSLSVWKPCFQSLVLHTLVVDEFPLPHLRWREIGGAAPEKNKRWGGSQAHCTPQSTVSSSCQAGNGFNRR